MARTHGLPFGRRPRGGAGALGLIAADNQLAVELNGAEESPRRSKAAHRPKKVVPMKVLQEARKRMLAEISPAPKRKQGKKSAAKRAAGKKKSTAARTKRTAAKKKSLAAQYRLPPFKGVAPAKLSPKQWLQTYRQMLLARLTDQKMLTLYKQSKCSFCVSGAGHEAVQVAAGHVFRGGKDWFFPYYRDLALMATLGMTPEEFFLNVMNKEGDPNSHGRQMPMHWGCAAKCVLSQSSPVGSQFPQAVGCALAARLRGLKEVVYVSAGDGACSQGDFHEALNWAAREKLPVVFLIENNLYAISVHISEQLAGGSAAKIASGYENLASHQVDGTDYAQCYTLLRDAHARALRGEGPTLIEAYVPRLQSHSMSDDQCHYRSEEELKLDLKRCPLGKTKRHLLRLQITTKQKLQQLEQKLKAEVDTAAEWAERQPNPDPAHALDFTYCLPEPMTTVEENELSGDEVYMAEALNHGLDEELQRNPGMCIFGQDVAGDKGGVFLITSHLAERYGSKRIFNAHLAESSIVGAAIGLAVRGLKPVIEIQFADFVWTAANQVRNELAMMHYRSKGEFSCPVVIRMPVGGGVGAGPYHSQNIEATFAHFPGLYIIYPSNATDAKGLLKSAIRASNPVLFLEHKSLYRRACAKGPEGDADTLVPIGRARVALRGEDATLVTWGAMLHKSLAAARSLEQDGFSVEVIDLRTIVPMDIETVFASVRKTNRVMIAHEDTGFMGLGAEIAAQIAAECFEFLDAPVKRVSAKEVAALPFQSRLERAVLPQEENILYALRELVSY
jgi:2-oxoisovalerate dehydrogenase E1 component